MSVPTACPLCQSRNVRMVVAIRKTATDEAIGRQGFRCCHCDHRWTVTPRRQSLNGPTRLYGGPRNPTM
jgi:transposase-like protein